MIIKNLKEEIKRRFWVNIEVNYNDPINGCWYWKGYHNKINCRPYFCYKIIGLHIHMPAARFLYQLLFGNLASWQLVCHKCDNPKCVNIRHLFVGTHQDNTQDAIKKNRIAVGERISQSKLKEKDIPNIKYLNKYCTQGEIAKLYGVSHATVNRILGGYAWIYVK